jgi:hypothetical protein
MAASRRVASAIKSTVHNYWSGCAQPPAPTFVAPLHTFSSLCLQQLRTRKSLQMRSLLFSLQNRLSRGRPPLSHGPKSGFCLFFSLQNHLHPRSYILSHQRSVTFSRLRVLSFLLIHPPQFVRNVGITHGDESRVGYYVGMMVSPGVNLYTGHT